MLGVRRRKPISPLWQWNRIYPGGPFRPKDIPFTGEEKLFLQCQEILHHKTSSSILQDSKDQEDYIQISFLGFQDEITG